MNFRPTQTLTEKQIQSGLQFIVKEGAAAEAMTTLTSGTFLVAMAVILKATNFQIGLLAALPTLTNIFQLFAIWLVKKYRNRRLICVVCNIIARVPLLLIGFLPLVFSSATSLQALLFLLFFSYFFGSLAGASWNSWMKDLVPEKLLGTYFSRRGRILQILNVTLSLVLAIAIDYIKKNYPLYELQSYVLLFVIGGALGMFGVYLLSRAPEPATSLEDTNVFRLLYKPLQDKNFRHLLTFNAAYAFAINLALPFFAVFMMKTLALTLTTIIGLGLLAKLSSIVSIKQWGRYTDSYSNKTIILICAPTFITCILAWSFTSFGNSGLWTIGLLALIHIISGASAAGIDLAINNMSIKLAPRDQAIAYLSARNVIVSMFTALAPITGGLMADYFASHHLSWSVQWSGPQGSSTLHLLNLNNWTFYFVLGAFLAAGSIRLLKYVQEDGEVNKRLAAAVIKKDLRRNLRSINSQAIMYRIKHPVIFILITRKIAFMYHRIMGMLLWHSHKR